MHIACENGDLEMVKLLQSFGGDIEILDKEASTPLIYACEQGRLDIV